MILCAVEPRLARTRLRRVPRTEHQGDSDASLRSRSDPHINFISLEVASSITRRDHIHTYTRNKVMCGHVSNDCL